MAEALRGSSGGYSLRPLRPLRPLRSLRLSTMQRAELESLWLPFTANRQFKENPRLLIQGRGHVLLDARGPKDPRRHRGAVVRGGGPRAPRDHLGGRAPDRADGLCPAVPDGPSAGIRARERTGEDRAPRARPCVLHATPAPRRSTLRSRSRLRITASAARRRARASSGASALITAWDSAASRSAAWSPTARCGRHRCCPARTICRTRTTSSATRSRAASLSTARQLADDLERLVALHDASSIAAVIVEPIAGLDRRADSAARAICSVCARSATGTASCSSSTR